MTNANTPALPANYQAFDRGRLGIQLKWDLANDDPPITGYEMRYNPSPPLTKRENETDEAFEARVAAHSGWTAWEAIQGADATTKAVFFHVEKERTDYQVRLRAVRGDVKGPEALAHVTTGEILDRRHQVYFWARHLMQSEAYKIHLARGHDSMKQIDEFVCHVVQLAAFSDGDHLLQAKLWTVVQRNMNLDLMQVRQRLYDQVRILDNWKLAKFDREFYQVNTSWRVEKVVIAGVEIPGHLGVRQTDVDSLVLGG